MLAYYVEWHLRRVFFLFLFDEHDPEGKAEVRQSVVASAHCSAIDPLIVGKNFSLSNSSGLAAKGRSGVRRE